MSGPATICLHGPESTGKSTLCALLATRFGAELVTEYGRSFCETYGTELTMDDLVDIAETHDAMTVAAKSRGGSHLILDTDPLMTAVWADMLFGERDPWFDAWTGTADLYLLLDIDIPWVDDGTRMFGAPAERSRFFELSRAELERRGVRWALISGPAAETRLAGALAAIEAAGLGRPAG
ncbi:AAA family ATPase [Sphingomonas jatrophae]|uniref:Nicotinamide-nucleotide adenylyltransferase, NadR type n=1 Tax=Sphingomonas jatrophae TaxID=1166337 RepID=A0A1I6K5E4_9SPHN|nr:ATP-binding protein [Sphingomonas jatrophae]SFR86308.1 nicotinamide-nucleotide adenylyltransferase, NadR type [Sphingomonas jatrophae]